MDFGLGKNTLCYSKQLGGFVVQYDCYDLALFKDTQWTALGETDIWTSGGYQFVHDEQRDQLFGYTDSSGDMHEIDIASKSNRELPWPDDQDEGFWFWDKQAQKVLLLTNEGAWHLNDDQWVKVSSHDVDLDGMEPRTGTFWDLHGEQQIIWFNDWGFDYYSWNGKELVELDTLSGGGEGFFIVDHPIHGPMCFDDNKWSVWSQTGEWTETDVLPIPPKPLWEAEKVRSAVSPDGDIFLMTEGNDDWFFDGLTWFKVAENSVEPFSDPYAAYRPPFSYYFENANTGQCKQLRFEGIKRPKGYLAQGAIGDELEEKPIGSETGYPPLVTFNNGLRIFSNILRQTLAEGYVLDEAKSEGMPIAELTQWQSPTKRVYSRGDEYYSIQLHHDHLFCRAQMGQTVDAVYYDDDLIAFKAMLDLGAEKIAEGYSEVLPRVFDFHLVNRSQNRFWRVVGNADANPYSPDDAQFWLTEGEIGTNVPGEIYTGYISKALEKAQNDVAELVKQGYEPNETLPYDLVEMLALGKLQDRHAMQTAAGDYFAVRVNQHSVYTCTEVDGKEEKIKCDFVQEAYQVAWELIGQKTAEGYQPFTEVLEEYAPRETYSYQAHFERKVGDTTEYWQLAFCDDASRMVTFSGEYDGEEDMDEHDWNGCDTAPKEADALIRVALKNGFQQVCVVDEKYHGRTHPSLDVSVPIDFTWDKDSYVLDTQVENLIEDEDHECLILGQLDYGVLKKADDFDHSRVIDQFLTREYIYCCVTLPNKPVYLGMPDCVPGEILLNESFEGFLEQLQTFDLDAFLKDIDVEDYYDEYE